MKKLRSCLVLFSGDNESQAFAGISLALSTSSEGPILAWERLVQDLAVHQTQRLLDRMAAAAIIIL